MWGQALSSMRSLFAVAALLALSSGCILVPQTVVPFAEDDKALLLYLDASPGLRIATPEGAAEFRADASTTSGASTALSYQNGGAPQTFEFKLKSPTAQNYYLNLSKSVQGILYWSSATQSAGGGAPNNPEATHLRIELLVDGIIAGGDEWSFGALAQPFAWQPMGFTFRPEVATIHPGSVLSVKVFRFSGASDFLIGTGGTHASYVEIRYLEEDPLAAALYLDRGVLLTAPGGASEGSLAALAHFAATTDLERLPKGLVVVREEPAPDSRSSLGFAPLALAGLAMGLRRRRAPVLVVMLLLAGGLAGCLGQDAPRGPNGTDAPGTGEPSPTVQQRLEDRPDLAAAGHGAIEGLVRDVLNFSIPSVHVSILATPIFGRTDSRGLFAFPNVTAGRYTIRFDADGYVPLEEVVPVEKGKVTKMNVTLVKPGTSGANAKPHVHDDWNGAASKELLNRAFTLQASGATESGSQSYCVTAAYDCSRALGLPTGVVVPPGTTRLEVTLEWSGSNAPRELAIFVTTALNQTPALYVPRPSKTPFNVVFFPSEADAGHQRFSFFTFKVAVHPRATLYEFMGQQLVAAFTQGNIKIVAHKGVVPYEPAHRDLWNGATEIQIFKNAPLTSSLICCGHYPRSDYSWQLKPGHFVPPGTKEIKGTFTWTGQQGTPAVNQWKLAYRPANVAPAEWEGHLKHAQGTPSGNKLDFTIVPLAGETDAFYQSATNWQFYPDPDEPTEDPVLRDYVFGPAAWGNSWTLTATVHRDPAWIDEGGG